MSGYCFLLAERGVRNLEKTKSEWAVGIVVRGLDVELGVYVVERLIALAGLVESKERRLFSLPAVFYEESNIKLR